MILKNKKIKAVELVCENCECFEIPINVIEQISIKNIKLDISGRCPDQITEECSCDKLSIDIKSEALKIKGTVFGNETKSTLKRNLKFNNICHVNLIFEDDSNCCIAVPWGNDDYFNEHMCCSVSDNYIFINISNDINQSKNPPKDVELGQMMFANNNIYPTEVSPLTEAAISHIRDYLKIHLWNKNQEEMDPFEDGEKFKNDVFEVEAYSWNDDYDQKYNFKWKDYELSWYKHFGRGMTANRELSPDEVSVMLNECLKSIQEAEIEFDN